MLNTLKTENVQEIPPYGLRAYALFFSKYGITEEFSQKELDWIVGQSMKKKIFSLLLNSGWVIKKSKNSYVCVNPNEIFKKILQFKVQKIIRYSKKPYSFTGLSAIEIWSDYAYTQRGIEKSPYFIKILKKDLRYWKAFFNKYKILNYIGEGTTIGEYVVLIPVSKIKFFNKENLKVDSLKETIKQAKANSLYSYPYNYMVKKYEFSN